MEKTIAFAIHSVDPLAPPSLGWEWLLTISARHGKRGISSPSLTNREKDVPPTGLRLCSSCGLGFTVGFTQSTSTIFSRRNYIKLHQCNFGIAECQSQSGFSQLHFTSVIFFHAALWEQNDPTAAAFGRSCDTSATADSLQRYQINRFRSPVNWLTPIGKRISLPQILLLW